MKSVTETVGGLGGCLVLMIILYLPCALWTDRTLDFWLTYAKGTPVDSPFWISCAASVLSPAAYTLNLVSEIVRLAV
jgi:hypothetical protein